MTRRPISAALSTFAAALVLCSLSSCYWISTQRWPEPNGVDVSKLPPGADAVLLPGPEEVTVIRHADPVRLRPAGTSSGGFPLQFYDKRKRVTAGSAVLVSPGGRAEVLWPSGSSVVMFGKGVGWIGSPSHGEPTFGFAEVERARINLLAGDRVQLMGGAVLSGDSGPYLVDRVREDVLRVVNQSRATIKVAFRDETFELGPGQKVLLPLLSAGGDPDADGGNLRRISGPGFPVEVRGALTQTPEEHDVVLNASGENEMRALGVRVRLEPGEQAVFSGLERRVETAPPPEPPPKADGAEVPPTPPGSSGSGPPRGP